MKIKKMAAAVALATAVSMGAVAPVSQGFAPLTIDRSTGVVSDTPTVLIGTSWKVPVVKVFDGTPQPNNWKVAEAVSEWEKRSGLNTAMTSNESEANIVIKETDQWPCGYTGAAGCAYYPPASGYGQVSIQLASWYADYGVAEHVAIHELGHSLGLAHAPEKKRSVMKAQTSIYDYYTSPQSYDYGDMKTLYGR